MSTVEHVPDAESTTTNVDQPVRRSTADVVVSVGTDHHRFDRLIAWIDEWRDLHPDVVVVVQSGTSSPSRHDSRELIPHGELLGLFRGASVVVSHGGPSTVMDARMAGRLPIVVARNPAHQEHVDEHQMRFAEHLARHGMAVVVDNRDDLFAVMDRAVAEPEAFTVTADHDTAVGVTAFGRAVDQLIGTRTPIGRTAAVGPGPPAPAAPAAPAASAEQGTEATKPVVDRRRSASTPYLFADRRKPTP